MSDVIPSGEKPNPMETANDYLLDAIDYTNVLILFLHSDHKFDLGSAMPLVNEIGRLMEAARLIIVDACANAGGVVDHSPEKSRDHGMSEEFEINISGKSSAERCSDEIWALRYANNLNNIFLRQHQKSPESMPLIVATVRPVTECTRIDPRVSGCAS